MQNANVLERSAVDSKQHSRHQQYQAIEELAEHLKRLMTRHHTLLHEEGVRKHMERLERWLEDQQHGPAPAHIVTETGMTWLCELRDRLKLSADEILRLEGEGGNPPTIEQSERTEELLKVVRRIEKIIDDSCAVKAH